MECCDRRIQSSTVRVRLIVLMVMPIVLTSALPARSCDGPVLETNQEHFRRAVLAYEAIAVDEDFNFEVVKTWRGQPRDTLTVTWPRHHLDACEGVFPSRPGERYLVTIECDSAEDQDRLDCPARVDPVIAVPHRLRYLAYHQSLSRQDLLTKLEHWLAGRLTDEELVLWAIEMAVVGEVADWITFADETQAAPFSYLTAVLHEFDSTFRHVDSGDELEACEREHLARTIVPTLLATLGRATPPDRSDTDRLYDLFDLSGDC